MFKRLNAAAQRGLLDVQLLRGTAKALRLRSDDGIAQLADRRSVRAALLGQIATGQYQDLAALARDPVQS
jgi:hypothetical protein